MLRNCKLELSITLLGVLWIISSKNYPTVLQILKKYLSDDRCAGIVSYLTITIGIYVTVWSIFATSAAKINEELLKKKVEGQLFFVIILALFETFISIILVVFIPDVFSIYTNLLLIFILLASISFIKFIILLMRLTKVNIGFIVKEIDEQKQQHTELLVKIDELYQRITKTAK